MITIKTVALLLIMSNDTLPSPDSTSRPFVTVEHLKAESFMLTQVSHLSDFIEIFNFGTDSVSIKNDTLHTLRSNREAKVAQLVDAQLLSSYNGASALKKNLPTFLRDITDDLTITHLRFPPEQLYATELVWVNYQSKKQAIQFYLKLLPHRKGYSWFIESISADFLKNIKSEKKSNITQDSTAYIAPNSHETAFLDLFNLIRDKKDLINILSPAQKGRSQNFERLRELVKNGEIKPLQTETPELYIGINSTWVAKLSFMNRKTDNSGWLITDLFFLPTEKERLKAFFSFYTF